MVQTLFMIYPKFVYFIYVGIAKKINKNSDATKITNKLIKSFFKNYHEFLSDNTMFTFDTIYEFSVHVNIINYKCHCCNNLE